MFDFRSKVLYSFVKIKKDISLISKESKTALKSVKSLNFDFSKVSSRLDGIENGLISLKKSSLNKKENNSSKIISVIDKSLSRASKDLNTLLVHKSKVDKQLSTHSKILKELSNKKPPIFFQRSENKGDNRAVLSKIGSVRSELKAEIEGLKYEFSKTSENSYQAYSDSIIVQREITRLKRENSEIHNLFDKKTVELETLISDVKSNLKQMDKLKEEVLSKELKMNEFISNASSTSISFKKSKKDLDITVIDPDVKSTEKITLLEDEISFLRSRVNQLEKQSLERGPLSVSGDVLKNQKTIFSFEGSVKKPIVKMFTRSKAKKSREVAVELSNAVSYKKNDKSSASMNYIPQPWSKIAGYKKVERKGKSMGSFW